MATGSEANKFWKLFEELESRSGGVYANDLILTNLIKFLPSHILDSFVDDFRQVYEVKPVEVDEPDSETEIISMRHELVD
tara:strand:- start:97 stop:336 length:240 start_codon:yes stop_codon:yes gene_type:complete